MKDALLLGWVAVQETFAWLYTDHAWVLIILAAYLGWLIG